MYFCRFSLFCLVSILCICFCVGSSYMMKCVETDKQALLKLKDGFNDTSHILSSWKGEDCCKWKGVSCNNLTGQVTMLDLEFIHHDASFGGKIDSSVCELQHLTSLNLNYNNLEGKIPNCIGSLSQLIDLKLNGNSLVGDIPHTLGNLSNLQTLDLGTNIFMGYDLLVATDLEWVSHLSNLRYLDMSYANLSGAIDWLSSISKIPSLSELHLFSCGLHLDPKSIPHMNSSTHLKILSLSSNNLNSSILSWVLNVSKVLTYLDISNNQLEGDMSKSFQSLCQVEELSLDSNKLSGHLSEYIAPLHCAQNSLKVLDLSNNPFSSGPLPDFSRFSFLNTLHLQNTNIVGLLPQSLGHMPYLASLDLSFNQLNGSLSSFEVSELTSLQELVLSHNQLSGTLPSKIGQLSNLTRLSLSSNKLNGVISESHLSKLSSLNTLRVAKNSFSFNLSSSWAPSFLLTVLDASSCVLGPEFPTWIKQFPTVNWLDISNSGISDSFPKWFWDLSSNLQYLNVSYNKLSGTLPKSFANISTIRARVWDLSFNNLSGPLPLFSPDQNALFLSNNMFSGSLSSFCAMPLSELTFLDLSSNLLVGPLSDCWMKFQRLLLLNLANNNLQGEIPKSFGTLHETESMHLNNNSLSGEIPSLALCTSLKFLDFGDNILEGTLPTWAGRNLPQLIVLRLRGNKFHGNIPINLCNLSSLQVLDLSKNKISGEIPQCLSNMLGLSNNKLPRNTVGYETSVVIYQDTEPDLFIDTATLAWKGGDREFDKNLGFMTFIDLSSNHLTGEIPQNITALVALAALNLSRNNLTGFIPHDIGHLEMLESLDLSRNHLYGRMPTSFSNLHFLSYMDLSFNNLSGKIPSSTQLQSFEESTYFGNTGLCGPPLTNQCPEDESPPNGSNDKNGTNEDDDEILTFGFYVSLGIGFCVGFWGVCGTLVIKRSWRHAYFRFFNNLNDWIYVTLVVFWARMKKKFQAQE